MSSLIFLLFSIKKSHFKSLYKKFGRLHHTSHPKNLYIGDHVPFGWILLSNPIPGGFWADDSRGGGAKMPTLHIWPIFWSFQVGLEWNQKQMWNLHNEAPCWKKFCKNFENWLSNRNFCSPNKNSENFQKYFFQT